ncbi:hypothetical protein Tco_0127218 [Tanacetum coccineum]
MKPAITPFKPSSAAPNGFLLDLEASLEFLGFLEMWINCELSQYVREEGGTRGSIAHELQYAPLDRLTSSNRVRIEKGMFDPSGGIGRDGSMSKWWLRFSQTPQIESNKVVGGGGLGGIMYAMSKIESKELG